MQAGSSYHTLVKEKNLQFSNRSRREKDFTGCFTKYLCQQLQNGTFLRNLHTHILVLKQISLERILGRINSVRNGGGENIHDVKKFYIPSNINYKFMI